MIGVIAVFTSTYSVPISEQHHRTLGSFWFSVLGNSYVLATIAIALVLGAAALRRPPRPPNESSDCRGDDYDADGASLADRRPAFSGI